MAEDGDRRAALRRGLAARLRDLGLALELIAEDVIGDEDQPIDWVAAGPDGRAWVVLLAPEGGGPALLAQGLVQRAWVEARVPDWRQLAPSIALRDGLKPGALLVAPDHDRSLRIAAREAGESILLARVRDDRGEPALELLDAPPRPRQRPRPTAPRLRSVFRTGLTDADLAS